MNRDDWTRITELFSAAIERDADQRSAFLDQACADQPDLRTHVEKLIADDQDVARTDFLSPLPITACDLLASDEAEDDMVGKELRVYRIIRVLGRGGMGTVYLAERTDYQRLVAIKLIKRGMDTDEILRRFRNERQVLANLDHPHIARLLDGGTTEDGRSYFVMEYVDGCPIDEYCRTAKLTVTGRLRLFLSVCAAVQYAHQNLIVHRDLKPGNIFVTESGTVKLLDFGIAKLLDPELGGQTTGTGVRMMTPEYASPEHLSGERITTATDVYSLGVVLYRMLTGRGPYPSNIKPRKAIEKLIRDHVPERPSLAVLRAPVRRPPDHPAEGDSPVDLGDGRPFEGSSERLARRLGGDLDIIVLTALRKESAERYPTVEQMSSDISRHLEGLPISAQPDRFFYRARKFIRRNRTSVMIALSVTVVLVASVVLTTVGMVGARRAGREQRRTLYFNRIALARNAFDVGQLARVRELLDAAPPDLIGWEWSRLAWLADPSERRLTGHTDQVTAVAYIPGTPWIASGSWDKTIRIWNMQSGELMHELIGHDKEVTAMAVSPDGALLASGGKDKSVRLWSTTTGESVGRVFELPAAVSSVAFSPDGTLLVAGGRDGTVRAWRIDSDEPVYNRRDPRGPATCVRFSPDGGRIATGSSDDYEVHIRGLDGGDLVILSGHTGSVNALAFSPDGTWIVTASDDASVTLWRADTDTGSAVHRFTGHEGTVNSVDFSPDSRRIVSGGIDRRIKIWDVDLLRVIATIDGHDQSVRSAVFGPDGAHVLSGSRDHSVRLFRAPRRVSLATSATDSEVICWAMRVDGSLIASVVRSPWRPADRRTIGLHDPLTGARVVEIVEQQGTVRSLAFSRDGAMLASGGDDRVLRVWDAVTGGAIRSIEGHEDSVSAILFVDGDAGLRIVSADGRGIILTHDARSGDSIGDPRDVGAAVTCLADDATGGRFAAGTQTGAVIVFSGDRGSGREIGFHDGAVRGIAFDPTGRTLASSGEDGLIRLWDINRSALLASIPAWSVAQADDPPIDGAASILENAAIAFTPDGRRIVSGCSQADVKIWDALTGSEVFTLRGLRSRVAGLSFTPKGLFSVGRDGEVHLFEARTP